MAGNFQTNLYHFEETLWKEGYNRVMGLDEVGRGCLCGPVVAAGVILYPGSRLDERINDSKIVGKSEREELAERIRADRKSTRLNSSHVAISYAVLCLKK